MTESSCARTPFAALQLAPYPDWPAERQRAFLHTLLKTGDVRAAAASVGASAAAATRFRRSLGIGSAFGRAWRRAVAEAKIDILSTRVLRRNGLSAEQLARVDAGCHGTDKMRLTITLLHRAGCIPTGRRHG